MDGNNIRFAETGAGIPVLTEFIPGCKSAGYMAAVGTGSRDESTDVLGISHLLEHVVFRETENYTSYQMAKEMEGAGGELNAFTGREMTAFYGVTIDETRDVAKTMVSDIVANPLINDADVDLEKKIVLQELSMIENEPESYIHDLFSQNLWRGHPLSQDEGGRAEIVKGLGSKDLRAYYEDRYGIPNMAVFAAGNVDIEDTVAWAEERFDGMCGKKAMARSSPKRPEAAYRFVKNRSEHCHVAMGFPAYAPDDDARIPAMVLGAIIGSGTSSRLFQEVREKKALVYSVYNVMEQNCDSGAMCAYMSSTDANVLEAVRTSAGVFSGIKRNGLEKGELDRTKKLLKGSFVRSMESTEHRMYRLGRNFMLNGKYQSMEGRLEDIDRVTEDEVMRAAEDILSSDSLNITVLGKGNRAIRGFDISQIDI